MSTQVFAGSDARSATGTVFVDDTGRRRARFRVVGRIILGLLGVYLAMVIAGLTGSLSLPAVRLGDLGRLPTGARRVTLGPSSRETRLPAAFSPPAGARDQGGNVGNVESSPADTPGRPGFGKPAGFATGPEPGPVTSAAPNASPTATLAPSPSTTIARTPTTLDRSTTTSPSPPTTRAHEHGPPSTMPAKSHKP